MNSALERISQIGIVPVIKIEDVEKAVPLAKALCEGGLPVAEITFRTAQAGQAMRRISKEVPEMLVGAGTVLTIAQVDEAAAAGAKFIVSPGLNPTVVRYCVEKNIPITPGTSSPSDMECAMELGLEVVKFFPAEQAGGIDFLRAVSAPYGKLKFMPTGGITAKNLNDYLSFNKIIACGGTWMVKPELIEAGDWAAITALTKAAVSNMLGFGLHHVGVNCANDAESERCAKQVCAIFGFAYQSGSTSNFAMPGIEYTKTPYLGTHGHIAIGSNSVARAIYHLGAQGVEFDESTRKIDDGGNTKAIYLKGEFGGFAIHLVQK